MDHSEQPDRWLDQRRLESGLLRRRGRACPVFPQDSCSGPYTTLATSPVTREEPICTLTPTATTTSSSLLLQFNSAGTTWANGQTPGSSIPISQFFIAQRRTPRTQINAQLFLGKNLILTPGIYNLNQTLLVTRPDTVVLGIGFPTLIPENGIVSMIVLPAQA